MAVRQIAALTQERNNTVATRILSRAAVVVVVDSQVLTDIGGMVARSALASLFRQPRIVFVRLNSMPPNIRAAVTGLAFASTTRHTIVSRHTLLATRAEAQGIRGRLIAASMELVCRLVLPTASARFPLSLHRHPRQLTVWPVMTPWRARLLTVMLP